QRFHRQDQPESDFTVAYHLLSYERNTDVRIKVAITESVPSLGTVTDLWPAANWYECEVWDMFGILFEGHPHLRRILMPPTWSGHPARATEAGPFELSPAREDLEQEALRFRPEEWGLRRRSETDEFMFLNLGPNHPSVHGVFRIVLQL